MFTLIVFRPYAGEIIIGKVKESDANGLRSMLTFSILFFRMYIMLGTTNLHNGMILSTLSISSHGFAFGFPETLHNCGDSVLYL